MFAQRRRWANNRPTLCQRLVLDRLHDRRRERLKTLKKNNEPFFGKVNEGDQIKKNI